MTVMTETVTQALRRAAVRATLAPSVHNTQPWRLVVAGPAIEVHADFGRQLRVLDPTGRQLYLSLGCALFNARVSLASAGLAVSVERFPDTPSPTLVARISIDGSGVVESELSPLDSVTALRHTNRRRFADDPVPVDLVEALRVAAGAEGTRLLEIADGADRVATAVFCQQANDLENADPAYRAELRAWTNDEPGRHDGVPALAVPARGISYDDIPVRDFNTTADGALPAETRSSVRQCLLLLAGSADRPSGWLRAGEALERVLLEVTRQGHVAGLMTQVVEIPHTRALLRDQLRISEEPHVLLRVGRAPATPATRRRRLVDVLTELQ